MEGVERYTPVGVYPGNKRLIEPDIDALEEACLDKEASLWRPMKAPVDR